MNKFIKAIKELIIDIIPLGRTITKLIKKFLDKLKEQ
jgi:hypothetical protein